MLSTVENAPPHSPTGTVLYKYLCQEEFEDTKGVSRIRKSKDRQYNCQEKKYKRTNKNLQNITHKTKDRVTRTTIKTGSDIELSPQPSKMFKV